MGTGVQVITLQTEQHMCRGTWGLAAGAQVPTYGLHTSLLDNCCHVQHIEQNTSLIDVHAVHLFGHHTKQRSHACLLLQVRPYLVADGGNVEVAGVEGGNVLLRLQGACGTCPSSSATMKMGIERSLRATFGEQLKEVMQVGVAAYASVWRMCSLGCQCFCMRCVAGCAWA